MFTVFDIETTGLNRHTDDIIQFAYACFNNKNICYRAEVLYFYYPEMSWSEEAYAIHGISQEEIKNHADEFEANLIKMAAILNHANVIGHNSDDFDCPFVQLWLTRMGITRFGFCIMRDTMKCYRAVTHTARVSLINLTERMGYSSDTVQRIAGQWFGEGHDRSHDAAYDVTATALLALKAMSLGYLHWEEVESMIVQLTPEELQAEFESPKSLDPKGFIYQCNGDWIYCNHNRTRYPELHIDDSSIESMMSNGMCITKPLTFTDSGAFEIKKGPMTFRILNEKSGDTVCMEVNGSILNDDKFDLKCAIKVLNS